VAGLICTLAWFHYAIRRPILELADWARRIEFGQKRTSVAPSLPSELKEVARLLVRNERDLTRSRFEADDLRETLDTRVDAKLREMRSALNVASREADSDVLTGLQNRRAMLRDLPAMFREANTTKRDLTVALFDVDHFKTFNDTRGHLAGDQLLSFIGALLRACTRGEGDRAVRYGGDEFIVILPGASIDQGVAMSRRIRDLFGQYARTLKTNDTTPLPAISVGVASLRTQRPTTADELLNAADTAMYFAKHAEHGVATPEDVPPEGLPADAIRRRREHATS